MVLKWDVIIQMLISERIVESEKDEVVGIIRVLYEYYGVIIPVEYCKDDQHGFIFQEDYYILPALLKDLQTSSTNMRVFNFPSFYKLQRIFDISSFTPPGLIQKMIAKVYLLDNVKLDENKIWKNAFCQMIVKNEINLAYITAFLDSKSAVKKLFLTAYGQCMDDNALLEILDRYCLIVTNILDNYRGFPDFQLFAPCPWCERRTARVDSEFVLTYNEQEKKFCIDNDGSNQSLYVVCSRDCWVPKTMLLAGSSQYRASEVKILEERIKFFEDEMCRVSGCLPYCDLIRTSCRIVIVDYYEATRQIIQFSTGSGCFADVLEKRRPVIFTCDHVFKKEYTGAHRIILIGDDERYKFSAECIFKGNSGKWSTNCDVRGTSVNERRAPYMHDVLVLGNVKRIEIETPINISLFQTRSMTPETFHEFYPLPEISKELVSRSEIGNSFNILSIQSEPPQIDSQVISLGYPLNKSLSVDRGRVTQVSSADEFLARVYSEEGCSGGPALDARRPGKLIGILHGEARAGSGLTAFFTPSRAVEYLRNKPARGINRARPNYQFYKNFEFWYDNVLEDTFSSALSGGAVSSDS